MARRPRFHGPAANSPLGEAFLDVIGLVAAVGFAAEVSQCLYLCGLTFRAGDRGATNDMLVQSLRRQCGAREAHAAKREEFSDAVQSVFKSVEGTTQLIRAAFLNNFPRVLQLVQLGAALDQVEETWGFSALHWASYMGHEHVAKALLHGKYKGRGTTVELLDKFAGTPLMRASNCGRVAVARLLLSFGAKQELQDHRGYTSLHMAVSCDHYGIVALLCDAPGAAAALALQNCDGLTPLAYALARGHLACAAILRAHVSPK